MPGQKLPFDWNVARASFLVDSRRLCRRLLQTALRQQIGVVPRTATLRRSTRSPVTDPALRDQRESVRYAFADFLLDTQLYALYCAGVPVPLRPKAFHVLRHLLEHRDRLVTKDELCAHVWPAQFISDATIESCIKNVRRAIGDTGRAQQLILTRRGYGYL